MKMSDIITENDDKEFARRMDTYYKQKAARAKATRDLRNPETKVDAWKAGWQQGKERANKIIDNPIVNGIKKIDQWANRRRK